MKTKNSKEHLCDNCKLIYPECKGKNLEFGNGKGKDNIIGCFDFERKNFKNMKDFFETSVTDTYIEFEKKFGKGKKTDKQINKEAKQFNNDLLKELIKNGQ